MISEFIMIYFLPYEKNKKLTIILLTNQSQHINVENFRKITNTADIEFISSQYWNLIDSWNPWFENIEHSEKGGGCIMYPCHAGPRYPFSGQINDISIRHIVFKQAPSDIHRYMSNAVERLNLSQCKKKKIGNWIFIFPIPLFKSNLTKNVYMINFVFNYN